MLHRSTRVWITCALALLGASGCTSLSVKSDAVTAHAAAVCHSYAWAGTFRSARSDQHAIANPLIESRLRAAIASNLEARGVQAAATNADCIVGYGIGVRTTVEGGYPGPWAWGWGWGPGWGPGWGWGWDYGPYVFREGLIAVNLYEAKGHEPLWHATVTQTVSDLTGADAEAKINAAVAAIFTKYPG